MAKAVRRMVWSGRAALCGLFLGAAAGLCAQEVTQSPTLSLGVPTALPPIPVQFGSVLVNPSNTAPLPGSTRRLARVAFQPTTAPVLGAHKKDPAHQLLRRLVNSGQAAGNLGDLYENRDRDHSWLNPKHHPQLTWVEYGPAFKQQNFDYGVSLSMLFDAPLIGHSSTALTSGALWRSQARFALTTQGGPTRLYENYRAGQIHVYPEHRDHDPERGDLLPANTPYLLISQGSSGSDKAHLEALVMILAAFKPATKAFLKEKGLLAPTVQMVYRRARVGVRSRAAYLSGGAHPSVFRDSDIALARMVGLANAIEPGEVPPLVQLQVLEETETREGVDFFGEGLNERLFDTPAAIARVWRSHQGRRYMVVSAADTVDPNGRDLSFDWVVLRGDHSKIRITPLTENGRYARIEMDWQDPQPGPGSPDILSPRIDIGVFANNGVHDSAPSFVSVLLPHHETRDYAQTEDVLRVLSIDRAAGKTYADPLVFPQTAWMDLYLYGKSGEMLGWSRQSKQGEQSYDASGQLRDSDGRAVAVTYDVAPDAKRRPVVSERLLATPK